MFTTCVIIASAILFREFDSVTIKDWVGLICGFLTVLTAIVLLHCCKNYDITLAEIAHQIGNISIVHVGEEEIPYEDCQETFGNDEKKRNDVNFKLLGSDSFKDHQFSYGTQNNV